MIDRVVTGTKLQLGSKSIAEVERYRDDCLLAVMQAIRDSKARHGMSFDD